MLRYVVFGGSNYYPNGGWNDFKAATSDLQSAYRAAAQAEGDWFQVVDTETGQLIEEFERKQE